ncbi:iron-containing alcohol dehydrogenase [Thermoanaerobacterium thermosaccharolyticum]|uniref:Iron-containing alcohol dehydrogenase n=1 Tax=Thermoanaerobacterium thermosaccharolyticum (strain ATCC 7956 / DSM 571 / NCIMB 9385 / NCA 3814 / NCTC 13789 / WDCM 00135 / 2032) TaxID=580327 RepID=D9TSE3_THETC|nr:iron-containing alcohol dehydrogenase [Thermoanaerobacterium thermosaccharolyticum]ADL68041.1 iron-containing alcohol dehydrogenase [Thermoanaerobacterium thermosaccharolyticum DSM 571]KAA5805948.1 iron-containing alcohol dehydrogenase [Thermoanaerobacterium thermosaccharolyticum]
MKSNFTYFMPTEIIFGPGTLEKLATVRLPGKKALLVIGSGNSMRKHGYLDRVTSYLKQNNVDYVVYDKILPNPIADHVAEGAKLAKENECDFVIGLGGGSTIDSSKAIAVMAKNPGDYWDYVSGGSGKGMEVKNGALPIVAIPTTAGTGTESDPWAVVTKTETNEKIGFGCKYTYPTLSIVDPELMVSIPPKFTAYQGMDAFFHSVEGYLATVNQPGSDVLALQSINLITENLPKAVEDGNNIEARTALAWASTAAGIVESLSSCISHHSMEHALSAYHPDIPHGAGLIMLSVSYFSFMASKVPDRFVDIAKAMGEEINGATKEEQAISFIKGLKKLIKNIGMEDLSLSGFGVKEDEIEKLSRNAMDTMGGLFQVDPYKLSLEEVMSIYKNCF